MKEPAVANVMNKICYALSVVLIILAGYLAYINVYKPNKTKVMIDYIAEGSRRTSEYGKLTTVMFFRRYANSSGDSKTEQYYIDKNTGDYHSKTVVYCLPKKGAYQFKDNILTSLGNCALINPKLYTPETILGFAVNKQVDLQPFNQTALIKLSNWISPELNTIVRQESIDTSTNKYSLYEITWVKQQVSDPSIFELPLKAMVNFGKLELGKEQLEREGHETRAKQYEETIEKLKKNF